jgi:hypothetical protein
VFKLPEYLDTKLVESDCEDHRRKLQLRESYQDPISTKKLGVVVHNCNPSYQKVRVGGSLSKYGLCKSVRPYLKNNQNKKG